MLQKYSSLITILDASQALESNIFSFDKLF